MESRTRAWVETDWLIDGVSIVIATRLEDGRKMVYRPGGDEIVDGQQATVADHGPSLRLREDQARALFDALAEHFGHAAGGQQQRADFLHERGRVDKLTDAVIRMAVGISE